MFTHGVGVKSVFVFTDDKDERTVGVPAEASGRTMFADEVVLVDENTNVLEGKLERHTEVLEI